MENKSLNCLKAICAILVICIHCKFSGIFGQYVIAIGRIAVPIFFMISGYFSLKNDNKKLKKKALRIFKFMIYSTFLYLIYNTIIWLLNHNPIEELYKIYFNAETLIRFIIFNDNIFSNHLWFFSALFYCYIFHYLIRVSKLNKELNIYYFILIILMIMYQLLNDCCIQYKISSEILIRNFIFVGLPFYFIGYLINKINIKDKIKNNTIIMIIIISFIVIILESLVYDSELYIGNIFLSISVFVLALKNPNINGFNMLQLIGNKYILIIYVLQIIIRDIINFIFSTSSENTKVIIIILSSIVISIIINSIKNLIFSSKHKHSENGLI